MEKKHRKDRTESCFWTLKKLKKRMGNPTAPLVPDCVCIFLGSNFLSFSSYHSSFPFTSATIISLTQSLYLLPHSHYHHSACPFTCTCTFTKLLTSPDVAYLLLCVSLSYLSALPPSLLACQSHFVMPPLPPLLFHDIVKNSPNDS